MPLYLTMRCEIQSQMFFQVVIEITHPRELVRVALVAWTGTGRTAKCIDLITTVLTTGIASILVVSD